VFAVFAVITSCLPSKKSTSTDNTKVNFIENKAYEDILAKAERAGKPIMIDFYATWCGPCKVMDKEVFQSEEVATYFNENIISFKVNAEAFDGVSLAQKFGIRAYPTFIFLKQDGTVVRKHEGMATGTKILDFGRETVKQNKESL
jgi:thiol:disulfide interchange protein